MSNKSEDKNPEIKNTEPQPDLPGQITEYVLTKGENAQVILARNDKKIEVALIDAGAYRPNWFIVAYLDPEVEEIEQTSSSIHGKTRAHPFERRAEAFEYAKKIVKTWQNREISLSKRRMTNRHSWEFGSNELLKIAISTEEALR